jgi:hypothetical protein
MTVSQPYRPGVARLMGFDVIMYTRKEFTNKISPSCQLPKSYRPLTYNNENKLENLKQWGSVNFLKTGRVGNAHKIFSPRVRAEAIRLNAKRPIMTAATFNKFVNQAGSFNHGMRLLQSAKNYKVNANGQNYRNYRKKLIAKFPPVPIPKNMMTYFWRTSNSNSEFANRVRNYANRSGYTVNENNLRGILTRRAATRAGAKRGRNAETERMYLVNGKDWFNSNATNVTNKINPNNWVQTTNNIGTNYIVGYTNSNNVKTYKRKVANFNSARAARARRG